MAAGSFIGGIVTYLLGYFLMGVIRQPLISFFAVHADWQRLWSIYQGGWGATVIAAVAFGGGPYKIVTMAAGATRMDFLLFALVLGLGRIGRFLLVAVLARRWNAQTASVLNHTFRVAAIVLVAVTLASAIGFAVLF